MEQERQVDDLEQLFSRNLVREGRRYGAHCCRLPGTPFWGLFSEDALLPVAFVISGQTLKLTMHIVGRQTRQ